MTRAIILAAGLGSRLRPHTNNCPKGLVKVRGKPILQYQIDTLKQAGIDEIVIVTGYLGDKIKLEFSGFQIVENPRWDTTNMVASLYCAREWLRDDVIISYSDIIYSTMVLKKLLSSKASLAVCADQKFLSYWKSRFEDPLLDLESFEVSSGCISSIGQKVESIENIEAQYIGLTRFKGHGLRLLRDYLADLSSERRFDRLYMTDLLMIMIENGVCIRPVFHENQWLEIDTVNDLLLAERIIHSEIHSS
jgi:choline kinase